MLGAELHCNAAWETIDEPETPRIRVDGCSFTSTSGLGIYISGGEGHAITRCVFDRCGQSATVNPFRPAAHIIIGRDARGVRIAQNDMPRTGTVQHSIAADQIGPAELTVVGNTVDGYGSGRVGFGRAATLAAVDPETDMFTVAEAHGLADGDVVRFDAEGRLPEPLAAGTDYHALVIDDASFRVASAPGAGAIDLTTAG